jgi:hypothetical protein
MSLTLRLVHSRARAALLAAAACTCLGAAIASLASCLTAPPPDLPALPLHRPTILHDAVVPPSDQVLTELPVDGFVVPVVLEDPNEFFVWDVFVNYPDDGTSPVTPPGVTIVTPTPGTTDGGVVTVGFPSPGKDKIPDPSACNRIDFVVAHQFNSSSLHTPDSTGGDVVTWLYSTGGPSACIATYDAGDGAFFEAAPDGLPVAPQDAGDR